MEKPKHKVEQKVGKVFLVFAGICIVALPLIVFSAFSSEPQEMETTAAEIRDMNFDDNGKTIFVNYDQISKDYLKAHPPGGHSLNTTPADSIPGHHRLFPIKSKSRIWPRSSA